MRLAPPARNGQLVLRLEEPEPVEAEPGVTPLLRGTIVHQLLERFDLQRAEPPEPREVEEVIQGHGVPATADEVDRVRALIDAFALIFVLSIAITPTDTNPASRQRSSTSSNSSPISASWRRRNSAIVE